MSKFNKILKKMKANTTERILLDQIFKITPSDENMSDYLLDCELPFTKKENI